MFITDVLVVNRLKRDDVSRNSKLPLRHITINVGTDLVKRGNGVV